MSNVDDVSVKRDTSDMNNTVTILALFQ